MPPFKYISTFINSVASTHVAYMSSRLTISQPAIFWWTNLHKYYQVENAFTENVIFKSVKIEKLLENLTKTAFAIPKMCKRLYSIREKKNH